MYKLILPLIFTFFKSGNSPPIEESLLNNNVGDHVIPNEDRRVITSPRPIELTKESTFDYTDVDEIANATSPTKSS